MTTIDHAAEARKRVDEAHAGLARGDSDSRKAATLDYLEANTQATLALVEAQEATAEQARIANWIAYLSQHDKIPAAHREWIEAALSEEDV